ncbi:MAG: histidinol phosphate aminotransferase, partial [Duodenibacillus sp.]|nr:histidinol phosphate aminotransferase [Duodenibacillus sp.]
MTVTRRELFRAAGLGAGALMLGSTSLTAQAAAVVKPPFAAPTAARPMRLCFNENALGMSPAAQVAATDAVLHQASLYPFVRCG